MSSGHSHHGHSHGGSEGNLKVAFFLNLGFTIIEIIGGILTNSIAILSDALHDFGDTASLGLAWYFERLSGRDRTDLHTYGFKRFRLLGGLVTGLVLVVGLTFILWNAIGRLMNPEPVNATGMIALAILGVLVNGAAVLIGAGIMAIWDVPIIDPILSIGISLFVLWNVGRNLKKVIQVFLQTTPESFDLTDFESKVRELPGITSTHHTHSWSLDGETHVLSTHLVMAHDTDRQAILAAKKEVADLLDEHDFEHITIEVELEGEPCHAGKKSHTHTHKDHP